MSTRKKSPSIKSATIHDVAARAQVAIGTVSRYLNGRPVRAGNREKIEEAIKDLLFVRNLAAATIRGEKSRLIGFLVSSYDEFQIEVLSTLTKRMQANQRLILPLTHDGSREQVAEALSFFAEHRVDFLVLSGDFYNCGTIAELERIGIPIILFNNDISRISADRIFFDDFPAMQKVMDHLVGLGHKHIGFIKGNPEHTSAINRLEAYRRALSDHGIEYDDRLVAGNSWMQQSGYLAAARLLDEGPAPPTAIVGANYMTTIGALQLLKDREVSVPEQMSIVSYGDARLFPMISGGIDSIIFPVSELVATIEQLVRGGSSGGSTRLLECVFEQRGSSQKPAH